MWGFAMVRPSSLQVRLGNVRIVIGKCHQRATAWGLTARGIAGAQSRHDCPSKLVGKRIMGEVLLQQEGGEYNEVSVGTRLLIGFLCLQALVIRGEQLGYKRPKQFGHTLYIQVG